MPATASDLGTWTPPSIDGELAKLHGEYMDHAGRIARASDDIYEMRRRLGPEKFAAAEAVADGPAKYLANYDAERIRSAKATIAKHRPLANAIAEQMEPFEREFRRRGGWARFFWCKNDNGHVHSSMHCKTCYPTTVFGWVTELSGRSEKEAVEEFGRLMCTVCFPSAPTDYIGLRERATLAEKDAARAAKLAVVDAALEKGLGHPERRRRDGKPEIWFKTERAAYERLAEDAENLDRAAEDRPPAGFPDVWTGPDGRTSATKPTIRDGRTGKVRPASSWELRSHGWSNREAAFLAQREAVEYLAKALADKHGTSIEEEVAIAKDKSRWPKIVRAKIAKAVQRPGLRGGKFRLSKRGEVTYHQPGAVSAPYCCLEGCPEPARNGPLCEYHRKKHAMRAGPQGGLGAEGERRVYEREHQFAKGAADIQNPGARGGKFYFDKHGMVKYGDRPMGRMAAKPKPVTGPRRRAAPEPEPKRREAKPERPGQHMAAMSSGGWKQDGRDAEKPGREAPKAKPDRAAAAGPERDPKTPPPPGKFYAPDPSKGVSRVGVPASHLPPPPPIPRLPNLAPDERRAESAFADWFQANPDAAAHIFLTKVRGGEFGATNVFGTDDAKVLSGDYNPEGVDDETAKRARALYNTATHQTANAIAKRAFVMALDDLAQLPDGDPKRHVLATAGGVGAGKGFALKNIQATKEIKERVGAVWDSAGEQNSTEMAWVHDECKKRGLAFTAVFVHAEPLGIWTNPERGVVQRAKNEGRMVDARLFADSYAHGARIFQEWAQQAKDAAVYYLDNSGGPPKQLDDLPGEALAFDADKLYGACVEHLRKAAPGGAILRGGLAGLRIWGAAK